MRLATIILILLSLAGAAFAQSIGGMSGLGPLVSKSSGGGGGGGGGSCSPTGLIFNVACNSMYATVLHF